MNRRSAGYVLVVAAVLCVLFFFGNIFQSGYALQFLSFTTFAGIGGFIMLILGIGMLATCGRNEIECRMREVRKAIGNLKANGERIPVNLSDCEIKENNYTAGNEKEPQKAGFWGDVISGYEVRAMYLQIYGDTASKAVEVNQSVVIYEHDHNGRKEKFVSSVINKDKATLMFLLESKKQTTIYVDPSDRSKYYFDLEFLF